MSKSYIKSGERSRVKRKKFHRLSHIAVRVTICFFLERAVAYPEIHIKSWLELKTLVNWTLKTFKIIFYLLLFCHFPCIISVLKSLSTQYNMRWPKIQYFFSFSLKTEVSCPVLNPFNIREKPKYAKKRRHT